VVQSAFSQRAAASALSSGRVLNAIAASGAALCTALIGLKHRQAVGRQANASADHHTIVSLGLEPPLHVGSSCFIGPKQAQVRAPSAFGHLLQGHGDSGMDSLGIHARWQHGIGEIHGLRLLTYEQNTRHLTLPRGCASFHKAMRRARPSFTAAAMPMMSLSGAPIMPRAT
jgi:hypothetical protein